ncbi:hypothetical protein [Tateyamaria sp. SN3-11]|uniref:DUF7742 family protein n=1 Tax=Tateyamaria sp. SN3-11 TaxID=3092147 RepID=UPI0039EBA276
MRPVLAADLICAGRAVLGAPKAERMDVARRITERADIADSFRRETGKLHAEYGDGTLAGAARNWGMRDEPTVCKADFASALIAVLQVVLHRQADQ